MDRTRIPKSVAQLATTMLSWAERIQKTTPVGFEPTQGDPIGLAGRRLSHSAKVSCRASLCFFGACYLNAEAEEDVPVDLSPGPSVYKAVSHGNQRCFENLSTFVQNQTAAIKTCACVLLPTEAVSKLTWPVLG